MDTEITYEQAIQRLETLVCEMEAGTIPIDVLSAKLQEAQRLLRFCKDKLTKADAEIQKLLSAQDDK